MSVFLEARQLKFGKWRLYEVSSQALLAWRGDNFKSEVVRDLDGSIKTFPSFDAAKLWANAHRAYSRYTVFESKPGDDRP